MKIKIILLFILSVVPVIGLAKKVKIVEPSDLGVYWKDREYKENYLSVVILPGKECRMLSVNPEGEDYIDVAFQITKKGLAKKANLISKNGNLKIGENDETSVASISAMAFAYDKADGVKKAIPVRTSRRFYLVADKDRCEKAKKQCAVAIHRRFPSMESYKFSCGEEI